MRSVAALLALVAVVAGLPVRGTPPGGLAENARTSNPRREPPRRFGIDASVRERIDRGLEFLRRSQNPDGSWSDYVGRKVHMRYECHFARHVGATALAGMAFLSAGVLPGRGPDARYCEVLRKATDFLIRQQDSTGYISAYGSRMYAHAFATLFLAEAYGTAVEPDADRVRRALRGAVRLIVRAQNESGGWRYTPQAKDSDMSVTVCQVMALRAARNAGIEVPKATIDSAVKYVRRSFDNIERGFRYQIYPEYGRSRVSFALTACGVTTFFAAGEYNAIEIRDGLNYLWRHRFENGAGRERENFEWFYGHYYAVQAAFQAGGEYWRRWYEFISEQLVTLQRVDGSWEDLVGPNYATAMALIILQLPNQYLPITES